MSEKEKNGWPEPQEPEKTPSWPKPEETESHSSNPSPEESSDQEKTTDSTEETPERKEVSPELLEFAKELNKHGEEYREHKKQAEEGETFDCDRLSEEYERMFPSIEKVTGETKKGIRRQTNQERNEELERKEENEETTVWWEGREGEKERFKDYNREKKKKKQEDEERKKVLREYFGIEGENSEKEKRASKIIRGAGGVESFFSNRAKELAKKTEEAEKEDVEALLISGKCTIKDLEGSEGSADYDIEKAKEEAEKKVNEKVEEELEKEWNKLLNSAKNDLNQRVEDKVLKKADRAGSEPEEMINEGIERRKRKKQREQAEEREESFEEPETPPSEPSESERNLSDFLEKEQKEQEEELVKDMRASLDDETKKKIQDTFQEEINRLKRKFIEENRSDSGEIEKEPGKILEELRNNKKHKEKREEIERLEAMQSFFKAEKNPSYENQFVALDTLNKIAEKMEEEGETEDPRFKEILELRETIAENVLPNYEREEEEGGEEAIKAKRGEIIRGEVGERVEEEVRRKWYDNKEGLQEKNANFENFKNREIKKARERVAALEGVEGNEEEALLYFLRKEDNYTLEQVQGVEREKEEEYPGGKLGDRFFKKLTKGANWLVVDKLKLDKLVKGWKSKKEEEKAVYLEGGDVKVDNERFKNEFKEFQRELYEESEERVKEELEREQGKKKHEKLINLNQETVRKKYEEIKDKLIRDYTAEREGEGESEEESSGENAESEGTEEGFEGGVNLEKLLEDIENTVPNLEDDEDDKERIRIFFKDHGLESDQLKKKIGEMVGSRTYKKILKDQGEMHVFKWMLDSFITK